jgi:hypothetical protein
VVGLIVAPARGLFFFFHSLIRNRADLTNSHLDDSASEGSGPISRGGSIRKNSRREGLGIRSPSRRAPGFRPGADVRLVVGIGCEPGQAVVRSALPIGHRQLRHQLSMDFLQM